QRSLVQLSRKFDPDHLLKGKGCGDQQHLTLARPKIDEGEPCRIDRELSERAADHLGTARFVVNSVLRLRQLDYIEARYTAVPGSTCAVLLIAPVGGRSPPVLPSKTANMVCGIVRH